MTPFSFSRIANAETREQALEIALMATGGFVHTWRDDVRFRQMPYEDGFDICAAIIRAALDWQPVESHPLVEAMSEERFFQ
jgi:aromatic ring-opening dioxygenase catalytic subunit (LigB family)